MLRSPSHNLLAASIVVATGCGDSGGINPVDLEPGCDATAPATRTASCVLALHLGEDGGFGMDRFPEVVFGPPRGGGARAGSLDVLSLGRGGSIALGFGGGDIVDGPGPDFIVFENAFYYVRTKEHPEGDPSRPWNELATVSVSDDGVTWNAFPCSQKAYPFDGCAGWHAVFSSPDSGISPFDPGNAGGDAFDLATLGLERARFVRVEDVSFVGGPDTAGFDLDAIAVVHANAP